MRIRSIKPDFFKDDELAALPPLARLLFVGLWCMADCEGRLEDRPSRIRAEVLPYDECDVDDLLSALHAAEFITRYDVPPRSYIEVMSFKKHQRLSGIEASKESELPGLDHPEATEKQSRSGAEAIEKRPMSRKGREGKGREGNGRRRASGEALAAAARRSPRDESEWLAYVESTYPDWPKPDALSAHGWYESKAWHGVRDWRACAKTCYYRWAGKPVPRNGSRNGTALVGAHLAPAARSLDDATPELQEISRRIARREDVPDADADRLGAWLHGEAD